MGRTQMDELVRADADWMSQISKALFDQRYDDVRRRLAQAHTKSVAPFEWDEDTLHGLAGHASADGPDSVLNELFPICLNELRLNGAAPSSVLYSQVPAPTLNGFAVRAPFAGTPVIVLNHGLVPYVGHAFHMLMGLNLRTRPQPGRGVDPELTHPYCSHHSRDDFVGDLRALADGLLKTLPVALIPLKTPSCLGREYHCWNRTLHHGYCLTAEMFVILHEMGHVVLGHCDLASTTSLRLAFGGIAADADLFEHQHAEEYAADRFATEHLYRTFRRREMDVNEMVYGLGCLFSLMHVAEVMNALPGQATHPSALARWERVSKSFGDDGLRPPIDATDIALTRLSLNPPSEVEFGFADVASGGMSGRRGVWVGASWRASLVGVG
jgi:hypothetical protein